MSCVCTTQKARTCHKRIVTNALVNKTCTPCVFEKVSKKKNIEYRVSSPAGTINAGINEKVE